MNAPRLIDYGSLRIDFGCSHFSVWCGPLTLTILPPGIRFYPRVEWLWVGRCFRLRAWFVNLTWWAGK